MWTLSSVFKSRPWQLCLAQSNKQGLLRYCISNYHPLLSFPISTSVAIPPPSLAPPLFIISFPGGYQGENMKKAEKEKEQRHSKDHTCAFGSWTVLHRGRRKGETGKENLGNSMRQNNWMEKTIPAGFAEWERNEGADWKIAPNSRSWRNLLETWSN